MCAICSADADFLAFAIFVWLNIGQTIGKMRQHGSKVYISGQLISLPKLADVGKSCADISNHSFGKSFSFSKSAACQLLGYFSFKAELGPRVGGPQCLGDISSFQIKSNVELHNFFPQVNTSVKVLRMKPC